MHGTIHSNAALIGVFYLARGADADALSKFQAFRDSYLRWPAGAEHRLHVIFKGFSDSTQLEEARGVFVDLPRREIYLTDEWLDLGAYFQAAGRVAHEKLCFLNTASRICGANWLAKLAVNLTEDVGVVSCSGNYEAPQHAGRRNVPFPNPHLRTTGFMMRRAQFLELQPPGGVADKMDAYMLEHGFDSITRRMASKGLKTLLVGKNGRGYAPAHWAKSEIFRLGGQANLLIADNQTSNFEKAGPDEKRMLFHLSWGNFASRRIEEDLFTS